MALIVQKFGGTSVGSLERMEQVARRIMVTQAQGHQIVVVASAMAGETNKLVALANQVAVDPNEREYDVLLSTAETASVALLSMILNKKGCLARSYTAHQIRILTDNVHKKAHVTAVETRQLLADLKSGCIPVVAGFQGINEAGEITTLGRGGSDATAVAIAAALKADECQIFTDVDGVFSADPRVIPVAEQLPQVSYDEMLQMASLGAKVLQSQSVELACQNDVPLRVASSFTDHPGTLLCHHVARLLANPVTAVVSKRDVAKLTLLEVPRETGFIAEILALLASRNISIDMVLQHDHGKTAAAFSLVVPSDEAVLACLLLDEFAKGKGLPVVEVREGIAKLSLVGRGLSSHHSVMEKMFAILREKAIQIYLLTTSEIKISVLVDEDLLETGVEALHNAFGLSHDHDFK